MTYDVNKTLIKRWTDTQVATSPVSQVVTILINLDADWHGYDIFGSW